MVYQIRDTSGRKYLEREAAAEVRYWLHGKPLQHYEVWVLDKSPGNLLLIVPAEKFTQRNKQNDHLRREPDLAALRQ